MGVLFAITVAVFLSSDIWRTHGWPPERAELVAAAETPSPDGYNCTSKAVVPSRDLTWRSLDPPSGRPAQFTIRNACFPQVDVGEVATVVRVYAGGDEGEPELFVDPVLTYTGVLGLTALALGTFLLDIGGVYWFVRRRERARGTKRSTGQLTRVALVAVGAIVWSMCSLALVPLVVVLILGGLGAVLYAAILAVLVVDRSERLSRLF